MVTDVLVLGGGPAATWAGVAAAESGASVILVDKGYVGTSGATAPAKSSIGSLHRPALMLSEQQVEHALRLAEQFTDSRRFRAKPCKKIVDGQAASPSSWKMPRIAP